MTANLGLGYGSAGEALGDKYFLVENLIGSRYEDTLVGDGSSNVLEGGRGADKLDGGAGVDTATYASAESGVTADLGLGRGKRGEAAGDTDSGIENLTGSKCDDELIGDKADNVLEGGFGADRLDGGEGIDTASYASATRGVTASLGLGRGTRGEANGDSYFGVENLTGGRHDDELTGDAGANTIDGGAGNDTIRGGAGRDRIVGGRGDDTLSGDDAGGRDFADTFVFGDNWGRDTIVDWDDLDTIAFNRSSSLTSLDQMCSPPTMVRRPGSRSVTTGSRWSAVSRGPTCSCCNPRARVVAARRCMFEMGGTVVELASFDLAIIGSSAAGRGGFDRNIVLLPVCRPFRAFSFVPAPPASARRASARRRDTGCGRARRIGRRAASALRNFRSR